MLATKREKKRFVKDLAGSIVKDILADIESGKVPAEWDGIELRQLLAENFAASTLAMPATRLREYNNYRLTRNL